jgi:YesN/AraC family two-component response regulator
MPQTRILLVDDDEGVRDTVQALLQIKGFEVVAAASVNAALALIATEHFDVLLSDLNMPGRGDGLTVVSAMRHANPQALTVLCSGYPEMTMATSAILLQADQILTKPMDLQTLALLIEEKLAKRDTAQPAQTAQPVATILERESAFTIAHWLERVNGNEEITSIALSDAERTSHLPQLMVELVGRLRLPASLEGKRIATESAREHGIIRSKQGYTAAMIVEESRMLQVSLFQTLQANLDKVDFSMVLMDVMVIADEVDRQLSQAMRSYMEGRDIKVPSAA